jgi:hypothetical protein
MVGSIRFGYDCVNDVHIAHVNWHIETKKDCLVWHKQLEDYFKEVGKRVDIVYVCDDLRIASKIGALWGKYRADLNARFVRYSVRVRMMDAKVAIYTATSAALHGTSFDEARDVPSALLFITEQRRREASKS